MRDTEQWPVGFELGCGPWAFWATCWPSPNPLLKGFTWVLFWRDGEIWRLNCPTMHFCPSCVNVLQLNTSQNNPPKSTATHSINDVYFHPTQSHDSQPSNLISWSRNGYVSSPDREQVQWTDSQDVCFAEGGRGLLFSELSQGFQKQQEVLHTSPKHRSWTQGTSARFSL